MAWLLEQEPEHWPLIFLVSGVNIKKLSLRNIDLISSLYDHHFTSLDLVKVCVFGQP